MLIAGDFSGALDLLSKAANGNAHISYSQFGEDRLIEILFHSRESPGFYIDVGAHHPERFSNTHLLNQRGWRGINIDGDSSNIELFQRARPRDVNITAFISDCEKTVTFNRFSDTAVNTISDRAAAHYQQFWRLLDQTTVRTQTLSGILDRHLENNQSIELLNVDVEGVDLDVLRGNDWNKYRPDIVLVEAEGLDLSSAQTNETFKFMSSKNYRLVGYIHVTAFFASS